METISEALLRVTADIGKIKSIEELESYIDSLPHFLCTNGLLKGLIAKRRNHLSK